MIRSEWRNGFLIEAGPNTIQASNALLERAIEQVGLDATRCWADEAARHRYVVREGRPVALPASPPTIVTSKLFSTGAKLRLLREPFVRSAPPYVDESVAAFTRRRLGAEVLAYAVNPFVGGIFAGNPETLSLRAAFPRLHDLEQTYGSLLRGQFERRRSDADARPDRRSFSFEDGLQTLTDALADRIGNVHLNAAVEAIHPDGASWRLETRHESIRADAVVLTVPLYRLDGLDLAVEPSLDAVRAVRYPPVSSVALGFARDAVTHPLDGFGVLVPAVETSFQTLGTIFSSTLFPNRAPAGHVLLTTLVGGTRRPDVALASEGERERIVRDDIERLLGVRGAPVMVAHHQWPNAIPQYELGYNRVTEALDAVERAHPTLAFAGNYRSGVSVGDAFASGVAAADRVHAALGS